MKNEKTPKRSVKETLTEIDLDRERAVREAFERKLAGYDPDAPTPEATRWIESWKARIKGTDAKRVAAEGGCELRIYRGVFGVTDAPDLPEPLEVIPIRTGDEYRVLYTDGAKRVEINRYGSWWPLDLTRFTAVLVAESNTPGGSYAAAKREEAILTAVREGWARAALQSGAQPAAEADVREGAAIEAGSLLGRRPDGTVESIHKTLTGAFAAARTPAAPDPAPAAEWRELASAQKALAETTAEFRDALIERFRFRAPCPDFLRAIVTMPRRGGKCADERVVVGAPLAALYYERDGGAVYYVSDTGVSLFEMTPEERLGLARDSALIEYRTGSFPTAALAQCRDAPVVEACANYLAACFLHAPPGPTLLRRASERDDIRRHQPVNALIRIEAALWAGAPWTFA